MIRLRGIYDYGFRDYSPVQMRFTTVDPIKDGLNWYVYASNNPINRVDPTGLFDVYTGTVQSGDTLSEIAVILFKETGLDLSADHLARTNGIKDPNKIYPGDKINTIVPEIVKRTTPLPEKNKDYLALGLEPIRQLDKMANDNPYIRTASGALEVTGAATSGGALGVTLGYDGLVRVASGIDQIVTGEKPDIMNGGSIIDQLIPGNSKVFETAVDIGVTASSAADGDPVSTFYGVYDCSH